MAYLAVDHLNMKPFQDLDLVLANHTTTILVGPNNSGKTLLIKVLAGLIPTRGHVRINRTFLENISPDNRGKKIQVFLDEDPYFSFNTVEEELRFSLQSFDMEKLERDKRVKEIVSQFKLSHILKENPNLLSKFLKTKIHLARLLIIKPEILLLDDIFKYFSKKEQEELIRILISYEKKGLTLFLATISLSLPLSFKDASLYILYQGKIVSEGKVFEVLENDSLLSRIGLSLPFMADLSVKLKYYNLVDHIVLDKEGLVKCLWK